jgi:hypothetical protein
MRSGDHLCPLSVVILLLLLTYGLGTMSAQRIY